MGELPTPEQYGAQYHAIRSRTRSMIDGANDGQLEAICPTTPAWRVRDTLAHLAGVPADILAGRIDGVASDAWTQAQVDMRRDWSIARILDAWDEEAPQLEPVFPLMPIATLGQMVLDAYTHELDIAHALGVAVDHSLEVASYAFDWTVEHGGRGTRQPLTLATDRGEVAYGAAGSDAPRLEISQFDFFRSATGRRSAQQILGYVADGTVDPELVLMAPLFRLSEVDITE